MATAAKQPYNHVAASEDSPDAAAVAVESGVVGSSDAQSSSSSKQFSRVLFFLGMGSTSLFVLASIFYAQHCAQVLANEIHGTVAWSPQLAALLATIGLFCQTMLVAIPFQKKYQTPVLHRYGHEGYHTMGKVFKRELKVQGRNKFHKVILVYQPVADDPNIVYAKKLEVKEAEFLKSELPLVVIPGVPTSAIHKRVYEAFSDPNSQQSLVRGMCAFLAPVLWLLAVYYGFSMKAYSQNDFWTRWGLGWLFAISVVSSVCWAYLMVVSQTRDWLDGGACSIQRSRLPPEFFGDEPSSGGGDESGDAPTAIRAAGDALQDKGYSDKVDDSEDPLALELV